MTNKKDIINYINRKLTPQYFDDFCPNGLQVDGAEDVKSILFAVSATYEAIEKAVDYDMLIVHHGIFWETKFTTITGPLYKKINSLISSKTSLLGYHLPLDAHDDIGNNKLFLKDLFNDNLFPSETEKFTDLSFIANKTISKFNLEARMRKLFGNQIMDKANTSRTEFNKVAVCTGSGQALLKQAIDEGCDCFITGEAALSAELLARDYGISYYAVGHHASEKYGVIALSELLKSKFDVVTDFYDDDCKS